VKLHLLILVPKIISTMHPIYTIGHSNHDFPKLVRLLETHAVEAIADVRSHPYSRFAPQYCRKPLQAALTGANIGYVFLGRELGARSPDPACYVDGRVQYDRLARQPAFLEGIERLSQHAERQSIALLCAEKDPIDCHRALLVGRRLWESGIPIAHILADGSLETQGAFESRLLAACKLPEEDLFKTRDALVAEAYEIRSQRGAYRDETMPGAR
jgi:uncharacterized protein (DUF488 family)